MAPRKIMIIRHAEKPPKAGPPPQGVTLDGSPSRDELTARGWQRAGALVTLFASPSGAPPRPPLERPAAVFAAGTSAASTSLRPQSTVGPVALALGPDRAVEVLAAPGQEREAAAAILACAADSCLVCWEHKRIRDLVGAITEGAVRSPHWDGTRFDVVLVLTRAAAGWALAEVPQMLLAGDVATGVSEAAPGVDAADDDD